MRGGHGVHLGNNERVSNLDIEVLSDHWHVLRKATFDYRHRDGSVTREVREAYDRGNGVVILLLDPDAGTVLLTRQFRLPIYLNGHPDGMLIEAAAGLLDQPDEDPEEAIRREAQEESGVRVADVRRLFELFMSPGSVTERLTFFVATYSHE
jgi:nudix-type nucleoside diphosphatase (YffH/AdpP family)